MNYLYLSPALVLSKVPEEHITDQYRCIFHIMPCWMETPLLSIALEMLEDSPCKCTVILSQSVRCWQHCWKEWTGWYANDCVPNNAITAPN